MPVSGRRWTRRARREGDDVVVDLRTRLDPVSADDRPPLSGDQLRQAFAPKVAQDPPPSTDPPRFSQLFPTESLFVHARAASDHDHRAENRSQTAGDYYYDPVDSWGVLGLPVHASWEEVVAAHRDLAMIHHPDRHVDGSDYERSAAQEAMSRINVAYSVLRRLTGN